MKANNEVTLAQLKRGRGHNVAHPHTLLFASTSNGSLATMICISTSVNTPYDSNYHGLR